jgi:hypothetical protein
VFDGITPILIELENTAGWIHRILRGNNRSAKHLEKLEYLIWCSDYIVS